MGHQLQRLHSAHHRLVDLAMEGLNQRELAEKMGMTTQAISIITGSPVFQAELARRRQNHEQRLSDAGVSTLAKAQEYLGKKANDAATKLGDLLESEDERVVLMSAKEILDRAERSAPTKQGGPAIVLEAGAVNLLVLAIQESKQRIEAGQPVSVE